MPANELMLLHGTEGGTKMATRTGAYTSYYDARSGRYVRRPAAKRRSRTVSGLGALGSFGQATGMKATLASVKGVLITGAIAAAGAIVTDQVYDKIGASLNLGGWKRDLAKMATGIALGIIIAKFTKKPKLAAAFAIGPVVAGGLRLFGSVMGPPAISGLGLTSYSPSNVFESMYSPLYGAKTPALGLNTYEAVRAPETAYAPPPPLQRRYSMPASM